MAEPTSTAAAGGAVLVKIFGAPAVAAAVASALGFAFMWPHTKKEAFWRFFVTLLSSFFLGPLLVIGARAFIPSLFDAAKAIAIDYGTDPSFGIVFISAPLLVMSALPSWWILGALVRWLDKRKAQDLGEIVHDAAEMVREARSVMSTKAATPTAAAKKPAPEADETPVVVGGKYD
jgi:hypothetical protein